jgi:hypothetical protein
MKERTIPLVDLSIGNSGRRPNSATHGTKSGCYKEPDLCAEGKAPGLQEVKGRNDALNLFPKRTF